MTARPNGDGISVQSSANITIKNCFIRTWDEGVVVKNYQDTNSNDITVENCIFWTDLAQSMEIGVETNKARQNGTSNGDPQIYNVTFNNNYVIHALHKAPISIHNGDNARVHDIKWIHISMIFVQDRATVGITC